MTATGEGEKRRRRLDFFLIWPRKYFIEILWGRASEVGGGGSGDFSLPFLETEFCALLLFGLPLSKLSDVIFFFCFLFRQCPKFSYAQRSERTTKSHSINWLLQIYFRLDSGAPNSFWTKVFGKITGRKKPRYYYHLQKREREKGFGSARQGLTTITTLSFPVPRKEERRIENVRK